MARMADLASSIRHASTAPMVTMPWAPSSSTLMSAPVSDWIVLMTLPLGPMTSDLVDRDVDRRDLRSRRRDLLTRRRDGRVHDLQDLQPGHLGLVERGRQHVGGDAV